MTTQRRRCGTTLLELMAVLLIVGVVAGVVSLAVRRLDQPDPADPYTRIATARRDAVADGIGRALVVRVDGRAMAVSILADGRVMADTALGIDRLTGRRLDAAK